MKFRKNRRLLLRLVIDGMHINKPTLSAALFVGGESRRMGRDKAEVTFAGRPLWLHQLETLRALKPERILISARSRPLWCAPEIQVVLDQPPSFGPLSGLVAVLKQVKTTHLLVLAIDLPRMTAPHLWNLWVMAKPGVGTIPQNGGFFEPLCAIYPAETVAIAERNLEDKKFSLQMLVQNLFRQSRVHAYRLTSMEQALYCNVNTPKNLACLH